MAEVSVVIPTRNRWGFLSRTVRSVLAQEGVDLELIIVDDGSTDETPERLAAIDDARVHVLRNAESGGVARARNTGMAAARGEWIAWLDDDDLWGPRKLRAQLDAAASENGDFVWCDAVVINLDGRIVAFEPGPDADDFVARAHRRNPMPGGCSNAIARLGAVRAAGKFDESLHVVADWDYWLRLSEHARPAAVREPLVAYTVHTGNMVARDPGDPLEEFERFAAKHEPGPDGALFDRLAYADWVATGLRRSGRRLGGARLMLGTAVDQRSLKGAGLAFRALLGTWAVDLPRRRYRPKIPPRPSWLDGAL